MTERAPWAWTIWLAFNEVGNIMRKQIHVYRALNLDDAKIELDALISVLFLIRCTGLAMWGH